MLNQDAENRASTSSDETELSTHELGDEPQGASSPPAVDSRAEPDAADLLAAVREAAGWRVSPRQLAAAQAAAGVEEGPSPERLAELVDAMRGDRSQRQSRHAELWRALGAELAVRGQPSDPAAQRIFIGEARARAGRWAGDALLLRISLEIAASDSSLPVETESSEPLEARQVALAARWLRRRFGRQLDQLDLGAEDGPFIEALAEAIERMRERLSEPAEQAESSRRGKPSRRGGAAGRDDRSRFRARIGSDRSRGPRKRTHRRAKPAGVSRKPRKKR